MVERCARNHYGEGMIEKYKQVDRKSKVLIIDDFHQARLNQTGFDSVVEVAKRGHERIIILAGDLFTLEEITRESGKTASLLSFNHCQIKPFGYRLRGKLIEKWFSLGQEHSIDENEFVHKTSNAENLMNTLLGKSLLPSYPYSFSVFCRDTSLPEIEHCFGRIRILL